MDSWRTLKIARSIFQNLNQVLISRGVSKAMEIRVEVYEILVLSSLLGNSEHGLQRRGSHWIINTQ